MPHITESTSETLRSLTESVLQGRARNGFGLTGPALITAVQRGQPYPELEQAYLELLHDDAGVLVLDQSATATAQKVFEDMMRSFVRCECSEEGLSGPALVAGVRAYIDHEKEAEPAVTEDEMAVYLKIAAAAAASPRKKKRAA